MRKILDLIGTVLTAKEVVIILSTISLSGLGLYLALATRALVAFAPFSYYLAGLLSLVLACALLLGITKLTQAAGLKLPKKRRRQIYPDLRFPELVKQLRELGFESDATIEKEVMDAIGESRVSVWVRMGHTPRRKISFWEQSDVVLSAEKDRLFVLNRQAGPLANPTEYCDVQFNRKQCQKVWPKKWGFLGMETKFDKLLAAMAKGEPHKPRKRSSTRGSSSADASASCDETRTRPDTSKGASN